MMGEKVRRAAKDGWMQEAGMGQNQTRQQQQDGTRGNPDADACPRTSLACDLPGGLGGRHRRRLGKGRGVALSLHSQHWCMQGAGGSGSVAPRLHMRVAHLPSTSTWCASLHEWDLKHNQPCRL